MPRVCLVVLIGLPGAGKTTLCQNILQHTNTVNVVHICYDSFIKYDADKHGRYKSQRRELMKKVENLIEFILREKCIPEMLEHPVRIAKNNYDYLILIDDNSYYQSMRYDYYKIAKDLQVSYAQIFLSIPVILASYRNGLREEKVPDEVIHKMNGLLEVPFNDNQWESNTLCIEQLNVDLLAVEAFLQQSFKIPLKKNSKKDVSCSEPSQIHEIDILLRKRIAEVLREVRRSDQNITCFAEHLNNKRKQILVDLRSGIIPIATDYVDIIKLI